MVSREPLEQLARTFGASNMWLVAWKSWLRYGKDWWNQVKIRRTLPYQRGGDVALGILSKAVLTVLVSCEALNPISVPIDFAGIDGNWKLSSITCYAGCWKIWL